MYNNIGLILYRVNQILSLTNEELEKTKIDSKDKLDIFGIRKLVNVLGGYFMIKSDGNNGTTITITLDQKLLIWKKLK